MFRYDPARQKLALGLAFLAGLVDATGFVVAGGYFTSFMSGNTTRMGVDAALGRPETALVPLGLIAGFLAGVVAGALAVRRAGERRKRVLLALVCALLGGAAAALQAGADALFLGLAAFAMGLANNVFSRGGEVTVGVTYMTGALVRFGQGVAARIEGREMPAAKGYGLLWTALAGGAVLGGAICIAGTSLAGWTCFGIALVLCGIAFIVERGPTS
jgi:uncharacterized membrane protein YoaK (UPF0700 family)